MVEPTWLVYLPLPTREYSWVLLPTGREERGVFGVESIPVEILPSCQYMINIVL